MINGKENVFVKMDIEGGEWYWLESLEHEELNRVTQMTIVIHLILELKGADLNTEFVKRLKIIEKLNKYFYLMHVHGNNHANVFSCGDKQYPSVIECTYVNKKVFVNNPSLFVIRNIRNFPNELDMSNNEHGPEINHILNKPPFKFNDLKLMSFVRTPSRIPPIIHKVLIQNGDSMDIKSLFSGCDATREAHMSWKTLNPDHEIRYYSGNDCREFLMKHFKNPDIINTYDALVPYAFKCDFFRYCVLYIHGGYYSDWKQVLEVPLNYWIDPSLQFVCAWDRQEYGAGIMYNAFIAAIPNLPIFHTAINMIVNNVKKNYYGRGSLDPTGPKLLGVAFEKHYEAERGHEVDDGRILIGNHLIHLHIVFRGENKIVVKHPKLGHGHDLKHGNNYNELYRARKIYATHL